MTNKVAILIVNYNMVERCDALAEYIKRTVNWPYRLFVIDNGSDLVPPSSHTNVYIRENVQTTGGWLEGLRYASKYREKYLAYWFLITSAEFPPGDADPLAPLARILLNDDQAVGVHPALTKDSTTHWSHMITRGGDGPRRTWMMDNIASLYRADWFDGIGRFDPELRYAWGIDLETCWKARKQGRSLWMHDGSQIKKVSQIGYTMNRMNMDMMGRKRLAGANMIKVMTAKYGKDWRNRMYNEFVTAEMR